MNSPAVSTASPRRGLVARAQVRALFASKIRELFNEGIGNPDILPFWVGEPDEPTPEFIRRAGIDAISAGDTYYTHNLGILPLREELARYLSRLHRPTTPDNIAVTSAGVNALMMVSQLLLDPGDAVVEVTPLWPNLVEIPKILGAKVNCVTLKFSPSGWRLDMDELLAALKPGTRALYVNSPNNPTGWTISRAEQSAILDHCRRHGIWIFADDSYERMYFGDYRSTAPGVTSVAPSFLGIAEAEDRVVSANTFSKSWLMTGWRLGWLVVPEPLVADLGKLIEYNTSCAPGFIQQAGLVAVRDGEPVVARSLARFRAARDYLVHELNAIPGVQTALPTGAMYAFFRVDGVDDSLALCKRLVREAGLGLAPGSAFGPEGEGYVRWCFASSTERLAEGVKRLRKGLGTP